MRPVFRPEYGGRPVTHYKQYLQALIKAFGHYCSYCESLSKLDVEHVAPATHNTQLILEWSNLLLGCARCNRDFKRSKNHNREGYIWPDWHNTFKLMRYYPDGRVVPAADLGESLHQAVLNTIELVCLDDSLQKQKPLNLARRTTFNLAQFFLRYYQDEVITIDEILAAASGGYWSVWYTVFQPYPAVLSALEGLHENTDIHRPLAKI